MASTKQSGGRAIIGSMKRTLIKYTTEIKTKLKIKITDLT